MPVYTKEIPEHVSARAADRERKRRCKDRVADLGSKTFEDLTPMEKDKLLKELFIRAGLVQDSD